MAGVQRKTNKYGVAMSGHQTRMAQKRESHGQRMGKLRAGHRERTAKMNAGHRARMSNDLNRPAFRNDVG